MIEFIFLGIFFIIITIIAILIFSNKIIFTLGARNILKRKGYAIIVILGLMVGTGIISSALVIGDTMENMIETEILKSYYTTDEIIVGKKTTGESDYFNESIFNQINNQISRRYIDGLSPHIRDRVAVFDFDTNLSEPSVVFLGIDFDYAENFGSFINQDGKKISLLNSKELMIGEKTAKDLNAKIGHTILLYANNTPFSFTITYILKDEQRAGSGEGIYVTLQKAQQVLNKAGKINQILISNKGGVYQGMEYTGKIKQGG